MSRFTIVLTLLLTGVGLLQPVGAWAQLRADKYGNLRNSVERYLYNRPTVSPYLNLVRDRTSLVGLPNYQTLVRPLLNARRRAAQQQRDISRIQTDLSSVRQDFAKSKAGFQTGHPTRFMTYSHYYQALEQR